MAARNSDNAQPLVNGIVRFAPKGTPLPVDPTTPPNVAFLDVGWLTDAGIGETPSTNTNVKRGIDGSAYKTIKTDDDVSFTFETPEHNTNVNKLRRPGSTVSTTGATPEQQTITLTGTPTGGFATLFLPGYGTFQLGATDSGPTLATTLSILVGDTVTVSLTGGVYTVTFPDRMGNVGQMTVQSKALTGGTTPDIATATTVPGVVGVTATVKKSYLGTNGQAWILDYDFGLWITRRCIPNAEAFPTGTIQEKPGDLAIIQWRLDVYAASDRTQYFEYTTNPAEAV